jgi:hypothetical protein
MPQSSELIGAVALIDLVEDALSTAKKAKKHRKPLHGDNFYAERLASLRCDAANAFRNIEDELPEFANSIRDRVTKVFSAGEDHSTRIDAAREVTYALRTQAPKLQRVPLNGEDDAIFPIELLKRTGKGYLVVICRQMNGCFIQRWYDASAVMMRRLVENSIIEAYEGRGIAANAKGGDGEFVQLTELIRRAMSEPKWNLSRNVKAGLPSLRFLGHTSAHARMFTAQRSDVEKVQQACRVVVEEFLHLAGLLAEPKAESGASPRAKPGYR